MKEWNDIRKESIIKEEAYADALAMTRWSYENLEPIVEDNSKITEDEQKAINDLTESVDKQISSMSSMAQLYDEINEGGKISTQTLIELLQKYPQYNQEIMNSIGNKEGELKLTNLLFEANKAKAIAENDELIRTIKNQNNLTDAKIATYKAEIAALRLMAAGNNALGPDKEYINARLEEAKELEPLINKILGLQDSSKVISGINIGDWSTKDKATKEKTEKAYELPKEVLQEIARLDNEITKSEGESKENQLKALEAKEQYLKKIIKQISDTDTILKLEGDIYEIQNKQLDVQKDITEEANKQRQEAIEAEKEASQAYYDGLNERLEEQKEVLEEIYNGQIKLIEEEKRVAMEKFDDEIYALEQTNEAQEHKNELLQREADLNQKLIELAKAKEALENAKRERNTKMLTENGWEWIANPKAVREAQENIDKINQDIASDKAKAQADDESYARNSAIDAKRREKELAERSYDASIRTTESFRDSAVSNIDSQIKTNEIDSKIATMQANSKLWASASSTDKQSLANENLRIGTELGWTRNGAGQWIKPDGTKAYAEGGVNTTTGPAWLDGTKREPEVVLNNNQAKNLYGFIRSIPNLPVLSSRFGGLSSGGGYNFNGPIYVTANNADQFMESMRNYTRLTRK
jgi:hypothetical protein